MNADERGSRGGLNGCSRIGRRFEIVCALRDTCLRSFAFICGFMLLSSGLASAADIVERRGGEPALHGRVLEVSEAGVWVRTDAGSSWIPWDRVRRIEADSPLHRQDAEKFAQLADDLWRARSRVERGDTALAEPIFEKHFAQYRGQTNETALVVAEGYLRCLLAREARVLALTAAMEVSRLRAAGQTTVSYSSLPRVMDEQTLLCPALPPVWTGALGLAGLERELAKYEADGYEVIAAMASLYRRSVLSAMRSSDAAEPMARRVGVRHPGVEFLRDVVAAVDGTREERRAARVRLERRISGDEAEAQGGWMEAWARYHIGRSLLEERQPAQRQRGLLSLAHLPARFGSSQPLLAALALGHLSAWHEAGGNSQAAESLREELARRFPQMAAFYEAPAADGVTPEEDDA